MGRGAQEGDKALLRLSLDFRLTLTSPQKLGFPPCHFTQLFVDQNSRLPVPWRQMLTNLLQDLWWTPGKLVLGTSWEFSHRELADELLYQLQNSGHHFFPHQQHCNISRTFYCHLHLSHSHDKEWKIHFKRNRFRRCVNFFQTLSGRRTSSTWSKSKILLDPFYITPRKMRGGLSFFLHENLEFLKTLVSIDFLKCLRFSSSSFEGNWNSSRSLEGHWAWLSIYQCWDFGRIYRLLRPPVIILRPPVVISLI